MKVKLLKIGRFLLVPIGVVFLTSFTIDASDSLRGSQTALSIFAKKMTEETCQVGMLEVVYDSVRFCVDEYEAGVSEGCLVLEPLSTKDTAVNIADPDCKTISKKEVTPWRFVAQPQAKALCAKSGKRLPSPYEWYLTALGTPDSTETCNSSTALSKTGEYQNCRSGVGAYDVVGNVWEYVDGEVVDGFLEGRGLPVDGYVAEVDQSGMAVRTTSEPDVIYNNDYFWSASFGHYVVMRGGFYGSRGDGGVYAMHAKTEPSFASGAVGFRCVKDL